KPKSQKAKKPKSQRLLIWSTNSFPNALRLRCTTLRANGSCVGFARRVNETLHIMLTRFYLLPFAFCLLPFAFCLLPFAFCFLLFAFCFLLSRSLSLS
ncbi:MAG: hypothetical protein WAM90_19265, partial [Rhodanobacter sp.]